MDQEGCHAEKNRWNKDTGHAVLRNFIGQEAIRDLILTAVSAKTTVGLKQPVDAFDDPSLTRAGRQGQGHVIEAAFHVEKRAERRATHPQNAEPPVVREDLCAANFINILREI